MIAMAYSLQITARDHLVRVRLTGQLTPADLATQDDEVQGLVSACARRHCGQVLFDATDVDVRLGTFEMFEAGRALAQAWDPRVRLAILGRPDQVDRDGFFENVLVNRRVNARVFTDRARAEHWLGA